jgi:hypothetical protein
LAQKAVNHPSDNEDACHSKVNHVSGMRPRSGSLFATRIFDDARRSFKFVFEIVSDFVSDKEYW